MKVIGRVSERTLIVEITEDEIAQIDGFKSSFMRSEYSAGPRKRVPCVGDVIPVSACRSTNSLLADEFATECQRLECERDAARAEKQNAFDMGYKAAGGTVTPIINARDL